MSTGSINSNEVRLAQNGAVYLGTSASPAPTSEISALGSTWTNLGYVSDAGVTVTPTVTFGEINAWQTAMPVKRPLDKVDMEVAFVILQTNKAVTSLFYMGGAWTNNPAGSAALSIPSNPTYSALELPMVIDYTDDLGALYRLYMPRGVVSKRDAIKLDRKDAVSYGISYMVNDSNGVVGSLWSNSTSLYSS